MGDNLVEQKTCDECAHYLPHYFIFRNQLRGTSEGHCVQFYKNGHRRKVKVCEIWTQRLLERLARQIDEVLLILGKN